MAYVRAGGDASALTFRLLEPMGDQPFGYYPAGWHAVAGLVPAWPDASVAFNATALVPVALAWTLGLAAATRALLPGRPRAAGWAALLSASGVAMPVLLMLRPEGMVPNALATALLPALVAAHVDAHVIRALPRALLLAACWSGLAALHPNAALLGLLVLGPWWLPRLVRSARQALARPHGRVVLALGAGVTALLAAGAARSSVWEGIRGAQENEVVPIPEALLGLVSGNTTGMGLAGGFLVVALAILGGLLVRRLRARWWAVSALLVAGFHLAASSSVPVLTDLDIPWYSEPRRYAPALALGLVPLAALSLDVLPRWVVRRERLWPGIPAGRVSGALAALVVVTSAAVGGIGLAQLARESWVGGVDAPVVADDAELAMLARLPDELGPGRVLGSPFSGAAHLYALAGVDVIPRSTFAQPLDAELAATLERLRTFAPGAAECAVLEAWGVRYLYVDPLPWTGAPGAPRLREVAPDAHRLVDQGGTAAVYEVVACS